MMSVRLRIDNSLCMFSLLVLKQLVRPCFWIPKHILEFFSNRTNKRCTNLATSTRNKYNWKTAVTEIYQQRCYLRIFSLSVALEQMPFPIFSLRNPFPVTSEMTSWVHLLRAGGSEVRDVVWNFPATAEWFVTDYSTVSDSFNFKLELWWIESNEATENLTQNVRVAESGAMCEQGHTDSRVLGGGL